MTVDDRAEPPDLRSPYEPTIDPVRPPDEPTSRLSFRTRLTAALVGVAILPLIGFGLVVLAIGVAIGSPSADPNVGRALLFAMAVFVILAVGADRQFISPDAAAGSRVFPRLPTRRATPP